MRHWGQNKYKGLAFYRLFTRLKVYQHFVLTIPTIKFACDKAAYKLNCYKSDILDEKTIQKSLPTKVIQKDILSLNTKIFQHPNHR